MRGPVAGFRIRCVGDLYGGDERAQVRPAHRCRLASGYGFGQRGHVFRGGEHHRGRARGLYLFRHLQAGVAKFFAYYLYLLSGSPPGIS